MNKAGGLAGRPIEPIFHRTDPLGGTFDSQGQAACETFSTDKRSTFVVDNALTPSKVLLDCMAKAKVPLIWELHMSQVTNAEVARYADYLYRPSMPNSDRLDFVIDQLQSSGFFKNAKVAIARYDAPESEFIAEKVWKPKLAAYKIPVVAEAHMAKPRELRRRRGARRAVEQCGPRLQVEGRDARALRAVPGVDPADVRPRGQVAGL